MLQMYPQLEFLQARKVLQDKNWDLNAALNAYMVAQQITIHFIDKKTNERKATHAFNKTDDGTALIVHMNSIAPIQEGTQFYNFHTGPGGQRPLTYEELSRELGSLSISDGASVYFTVDNEPKF